MSQIATINGSFSLSNNGDTLSIALGNSITTTSSLYTANAVLVTTGSWQVIDQNKNNDFRIGVFGNNDLTQSLQIALGSTGSYASILQPSDSCILTNSGSTTLWAKSIGTKSALLSYICISST
jgi:hypothetical protein